MRPVVQGVLFWMFIGALGIALRGVHWDEGYERAQAMLGVVPYPDGHPLRLYAWNAFSIHYYSSAALLWLTQSALVVCGLRDLLCVWGALVPMFLLGNLLGRSAWVGHLAAIFRLANAHVIFQSYYDNDVWPFMFTSGELGLAWAMLTLWALAAARWRLGFCLLASMPVVHVGQMPPVLALGLLALFGIYVFHRASLRPALQGAAIGLAITASFAVFYFFMRQPMPETGGYYSAADVLETWQRFTYYEDIHRRPTTPPRFGPFENSLLALALGVWFSIALVARRKLKEPASLVVGGYVVVCTCAVLIAWGIQRGMGMETPYWAIGWLPYRLSNHVALLLPCLAAALLNNTAGAPVKRLWIPAAAAVGWLALRPVAAFALPSSLYTAYVAPPEGALFVFAGAAAGVALCRNRGVMLVSLGLSLAGVLLWMLLERQFLLACLVLGLLLLPLQRVQLLQRIALRAVLPLALVAIALMLHQAWRERLHLHTTPFEADMAAWFDAHGDPAGLLLAPYWTLNYQEKTGQPVFLTFETPLLTPYIPALGPTIEQMLTDAYDIRFGRPWTYDLTPWRIRSRQEWQQLNAKYGIRYVLSPVEFPLELTPLLTGEGKTLYEIPS